MSTKSLGGSGIVQAPRSDFILRWARTFYLLGAGLALLGIIVGVVVLLYSEFQVVRPVPNVSVPQPKTIQEAPFDVTLVTGRFSPPQNIRIEGAPINAPLTAGDSVAYVHADTPNGLAPFPKGLEISGGKDAQYFKLVRNKTENDAALAAQAPLANEINQVFGSGGPIQSKSFEVELIARDNQGNETVPTKVLFELTFGPQAPPEATLSAPVESPKVTQVTPLQELAKDIATLIDPNKTPSFFEAYKRALDEPEICGATTKTTNFVLSYRKAFDQLKTKLNRDNINLFYSGVCAAWSEVRKKADAARQAAEVEQRAQIARSEAHRDDVLAAKFGATALRNTSLMYTGGAILSFMFISLFLAFLAIENHSKALRQAVEALAAEGDQRSGRSL